MSSPHRAEFLELAKNEDKRWQSSWNAMSGADQAEGEVYKLSRDFYRAMADGKDMEATIADLDKQWRTYAVQNNKNIEAGGKIKYGPMSGAPSRHYRYTSPDLFQSKAIHLRQMTRITLGESKKLNDAQKLLKVLRESRRWKPGDVVHHPKHGGGIVRQFIDGKVPQIQADFDSLSVPGRGTSAAGSPGRIFFPASLVEATVSRKVTTPLWNRQDRAATGAIMSATAIRLGSKDEPKAPVELTLKNERTGQSRVIVMPSERAADAMWKACQRVGNIDTSLEKRNANYAPFDWSKLPDYGQNFHESTDAEFSALPTNVKFTNRNREDGGSYKCDPSDTKRIAYLKKELAAIRAEEPNADWHAETQGTRSGGWHRMDW